jgi:hypothetical protein
MAKDQNLLNKAADAKKLAKEAGQLMVEARSMLAQLEAKQADLAFGVVRTAIKDALDELSAAVGHASELQVHLARAGGALEGAGHPRLATMPYPYDR